MPQYSQYDVQTSDIMVNFGVGQPDTRRLPLDLIKETFLKLGNDLDVSEVLQYGQIQGYQSFRDTLAKWLEKMYYKNEKNVDSNELFVTNGNTSALHLISSIFIKSGDTILVEDPSYFIAIKIFEELGINIKPIPMDDSGINIFELGKSVNELSYTQEKVFLYTIPFHHNPTGICMSEEVKKQLGQLCESYTNFYVLSDEVYHFLDWSNNVNLQKPLACYHDNIISLGTFSKILAPSLRVGWIYSNNNENQSVILDGLNNCAILDSSGGVNTIGCLIVEELIKNGKLDTYIESCVDFLSSRCSKMVEYLKETNIKFIEPHGGYFLWLRLNVDKTSELLPLALSNKVKFHSGDKFSSVDNFKDCVRLSFSYYNDDDLIVGLNRLVLSVKQYNSIKVSIHGELGRLGSLISDELRKSTKFYKLDQITKNYIIPAITDVIVDVTSPEGTLNLLRQLLDQGLQVPLVIGTTGDLNKNLIEKYSTRAPIAVISNFSEGIPLMKRLLQDMNCLSDDWNVNMIEKHHVHKKDAPSGTALTLQKFINKDCSIKSIREGEIFGQHFVTFESNHEVIEIKHTAKTRQIFASGCLRYLDWIINQKPGVYYRITNVVSDTNKIGMKLYSAAGNILMLVENIYSNFEKITKNISKKYQGVDGVVFLKRRDQKAIIWQYYNNDGVKVSFCGNGARCVSKYIFDKYKLKEGYLINDKIITTYQINDNGNVVIETPRPIKVNINTRLYTAIIQNTKSIYNNKIIRIKQYTVGVPHLVIEFENNVNDASTDIINCLGAIINEEYFTSGKGGINVNFLNVANHLNMNVRTYERGVNRETGSCGSGCVACFECNRLVNNLKQNNYFTSLCNFVTSDNNLRVEYISNKYYLSGNIKELNLKEYLQRKNNVVSAPF